jgi:hypothetical protein
VGAGEFQLNSDYRERLVDIVSTAALLLTQLYSLQEFVQDEGAELVIEGRPRVLQLIKGGKDSGPAPAGD